MVLYDALDVQADDGARTTLSAHTTPREPRGAGMTTPAGLPAGADPGTGVAGAPFTGVPSVYP